MYISTYEKKIKVHTIIIDDNEIERLRDNPEEATDLLDGLLTRSIDSNGKAPRAGTISGSKRQKSPVRSHRERVECEGIYILTSHGALCTTYQKD